MRIIAGKFKNVRLVAPKSGNTRPTSEKLRGAVFNMLQNRVENKSFLDVFAGSGAMGLEALSRGAKDALFLEKNPEAIRSIRKNIESVGAEGMTTIVRGDAVASLDRLGGKKVRFGIIFVDPPYFEGLSEQVLHRVDAAKLLDEGGDLLIEESVESPLDSLSFEHLTLADARKFGRTVLYHYRGVEQ